MRVPALRPPAHGVRGAALLAGLALALLPSRPVRADDEVTAPLLARTLDYTDVADAFDGEELFDLNVRVGFERSVESAIVEREAVADATSAGRSRRVPIADSEVSTSTLWLGLQAGLYRNFMAYARIPLVLSEDQSLRLTSGAACGSGPCEEVDVLLRDVPKATSGMSQRLLVLDPSFSAATRSGVPHFDAGLAWGLVEQQRGSHLPTWVMLLEGRFPVGAAMKPCAADGGCHAGISRGTTRLRLETRFSYRVRHFQPYFGTAHAIEWATAARDRFEPSSELPSFVDAAPPSETDATVGLAWIPWEARGRSQRFLIDLRGRAGYVSAGRDYTPLFDALGSSVSPHLAGGTSSVGAFPAFSGLTQVGGHAKVGLEATVEVQAARYVRFAVGARMVHRSDHLLTGADGCSGAAATARSTDDARSGDCETSPLYFPVIDLPGQRFIATGLWELGLTALAVGQF